MIGWGDYADGIAARMTRQYSRLGALMDPVTDRLLVIAGVVVSWRFDLLPRWALAVLAARELSMLALGRLGALARRRAAHQLARAARGGAGDGRRSSSRMVGARRRSARCCCTSASALALRRRRALYVRDRAWRAQLRAARLSLKLSLTF